MQHAAVVADLQRTHARRQLLNAFLTGGFNGVHQQVNAHPHRQIQHVIAVLNQHVAIASLAVFHRRTIGCRRKRSKNGGGGGGIGQQRRHRQRHGVDRHQRIERALLRQFQRLRLFKTDRMETDFVARFYLADFPQFGFGDGHRADETAEAWPVAGQNDREIAGEVNRADGVFTVMHVRRMQPGFAAVLSRPLRFRANQPHTETVGVVMHLPFGGEEGVDRFFGEEIRRAVRPVKHADIPDIAVRRHDVFGCRLR